MGRVAANQLRCVYANVRGQVHRPSTARPLTIVTVVGVLPAIAILLLTDYLDTKQSGDTVHLSVLRDGQSQTIDVTLGG